MLILLPYRTEDATRSALDRPSMVPCHGLRTAEHAYEYSTSRTCYIALPECYIVTLDFTVIKGFLTGRNGLPRTTGTVRTVLIITLYSLQQYGTRTSVRSHIIRTVRLMKAYRILAFTSSLLVCYLRTTSTINRYGTFSREGRSCQSYTSTSTRTSIRHPRLRAP